MKKVGTITESRMTKPAESKLYPLVSDTLFGGKVKIDENASKGYPKKGVKGGTKAAAKIAKAKKVGKAKLLKDADKVLSVKDNPDNQVADLPDSEAANTETSDNEKVYNSMTDAKDPDWIQDAEEDIKKRGTEGKCTPITKKGCTGKAKTLAKTFKKMAKKKTVKKETQYEAFGAAFKPMVGGNGDKKKGEKEEEEGDNKPKPKPVGNTTASK